ncbi:MAG TPA: preprotein translocase subunit SecE, partial [Candidatus Limnocylindrales bacterium]|nr:preprotein translocase subunit SecE [Candidatus Limnocylindrales bacterium]
MADKKEKPKKRLIKKPETVREKAAKSDTGSTPRRIKRAGTTALRPIKAIGRTARKEVYLPLPDTKTGRFLNKRRRILPRYFSLAWQEVRQVKWPGRKETAKLTLAVFLFAIFFGL